jgi:hypothetical protein
MRLLLDECMPRPLKRELAGHHVKTVQEMGWPGTRNGALLRLATTRFDALLTVDQGVEYQQDRSGLLIAVVILVAASNDVDDLRPLVPATLEGLAAIQPGQVVRVTACHPTFPTRTRCRRSRLCGWRSEPGPTGLAGHPPA